MKRWEIYVEKRKQGMRLQEIADEFGVSRQCVAQALYDHGCTDRFLRYREAECAYPEMRTWLNDNRITREAFGRIISKASSYGGGWHKACQKKLDGTLQFKQGEIDRLLAASGMTYEQLFRREGNG